MLKWIILIYCFIYSPMLKKKKYVPNILIRMTCARLAQSVEHETLNLRVVGSSPTLGDLFLFTTFVNYFTIYYFYLLLNF
jgi:hypothetical protein